MAETILALNENEETFVIEEEQKTPNRLVLKQLHEHLCYVFLLDDGTKLVIVFATSDEGMEKKLLEVLRKNMEAFTWSISDIKGNSPSICMNKILMEDGTNPSMENQRRLNPTMKEVVMKEVLK